MPSRRTLSLRRRLIGCTRGTLALTVSQLFMGALTIGIATFRGTESYESFYYETQLGHANYGASKLAGDHARAGNSNANNNVISTSVMGPRMAVEGDNITVLTDGAINCAKCAASEGHDAFDCNLCRQFSTNYPSKMLPKLAWVRAKQAMVWGSLGKLSSSIDQVASVAAQGQIKSTVASIDPKVSMSASDPAQSGSTWSSNNQGTACSNSQKDALKSPMPGAAFPPVMTTNVMGQGFSLAMTQMMPQILCQLESAASGAASSAMSGASGGSGGSGTSPTLPQVPSVANATNQDCNSLQDEMQQQIQAQNGGSIGGIGAAAAGANAGGIGGSSPATVFSSDVLPYVSCTTSAATAPIQTGWGQSYSYMSGNGQLSTCTFNQAACQKAMLQQNSNQFMQSVGLPTNPASAMSSIGGSTMAPSSSDWNHSQSMKASSCASKPIDNAVAQLNDNVTSLISFGNQTTQPKELRANHSYQATGKRYFPDGQGDFAATPHDQQPFVAAWKYAMTPNTGSSSCQ